MIMDDLKKYGEQHARLQNGILNYVDQDDYSMVVGDEVDETLNRAIAIANQAKTVDGRLLDIISWSPATRLDECVKVTLEAYIRLPKEESA